MLSSKMIERLNDQINKEIYSGYLYLGMSSYALSIGLSGVANWFKVQLREEMAHAQKIYDYVDRQGGKVALKAVDEPFQDFSSVLDLFEKTLEHEKKVTAMINDLVMLAEKEKDNITRNFLQWFVTEQSEEEENPSKIIEKIKLAGQDGKGLLVIDNELGRRTYVTPGGTG